MRLPIVQFGVAYLGGAWLGGVGHWPIVLGIIALVVIAVMQWFRKWSWTIVAAACVGGIAGQGAAMTQRQSCRAVWKPGTTTAIVRVLDGPGETLRTRAVVRHSAQACDGNLILRLPARVPAGALLIAVGTYRGYGVFSVTHARQIGLDRGWRLSIRLVIAERIRALYGPRAGVVEALVLGRRDDLPPALREAFIAAGVAHLLAISGLHVGLFVAWIVLAVRFTPWRRHAPMIGASLAWAYVALLAFPAAATRAAAFITVFVVARYRQRHPVSSAVVAVGALAVATVDAGAVRSVGAWLSISAVWATAYGPRQLRGRWRTVPAARLAAASAAATIVTAPITAFAFGSVAPIGILTNLLAVPMAGLAVPAVLASLIAGPAVAAGAGLVLSAIERLATTVADLSWGHTVGVPGLRFALPWLVLLFVCVWLLERRPRWAVLRMRLALICAVGAWLAVFVRVGTHDSTGLTMHVLDVGQGDAIAIRSPKGRWVLVDAGPLSRSGNAGVRTVIPFLRRQGVRQLDALIVSHGDADHLGGAPAVTAALAPRLVLEPGQPLATALYREHLAAVDAAGSSWRAARAGDSLVIDGVRLIFLHPAAAWIDREFRPNENSVVLRVEYGCFRALLTGDSGFPVEDAIVQTLGPVHVLKVGHHGSAGSTGDALLDATRPRIAVVSVGRNSYGHPAPEVMRRLAERGIATFRTDQDGPVTIRTDGRYLDVVTGEPDDFVGRVMCRIRRLLQSSSSSSARSGCTPVRRVSLPVCSTISP